MLLRKSMARLGLQGGGSVGLKGGPREQSLYIKNYAAFRCRSKPLRTIVMNYQARRIVEHREYDRGGVKWHRYRIFTIDLRALLLGAALTMETIKPYLFHLEPRVGCMLRAPYRTPHAIHCVEA